MFQTMKVFGQKILYGFGFGSGMGIAYSNQDVLRIDLQKVVDHCKNINIDEYEMDMETTRVDQIITKQRQK
tara:strand:+ start:259 stop:471 length:213 start_codon:yes stop_codon:yes gene_type:complete